MLVFYGEMPMDEKQLIPREIASAIAKSTNPSVLLNQGDGVQIKENYGDININADGQNLTELLSAMFGYAPPNKPVTHTVEWASLSRTHYCLFVLENEEYKDGVFSIAKDRALQKYTLREVRDKYRTLCPDSIANLKQMPCIFAKRNMYYRRTVNSPVFSKEVFSPTLINYFYGKNGTGKSTIAKLIGKPETTEWNSGMVSGDYELQVYNEEFIQDNIQSYGNIPGVFTITKQNASVKEEADKKSAELKALSEKKIKINSTITNVQVNLDALMDNLVETLWSNTETIRKAYPETQSGFTKSRKKFVSELMKHPASLVDEEALKALYAVAYGEKNVRYNELQIVSVSKIPSSTLLQKSIVSSSHTAFADFLNALNATAWVSQGHRDYQHAAGQKCPYCQQELPSSFESDLASCFDEQYKRELEQLRNFIQSYKSALNSIYSVLSGNSKSNFVCEELAVYSTKFDIFMEKAKANVALLEKKENDPAITLELADLSDTLQELNGLAETVNQKIRQNNAVLDDKPAKRDECTGMVPDGSAVQNRNCRLSK